MKKSFSLLAITLMAVIFWAASCSKKDNPSGGGSANEGQIKAKVDNNWVTTLAMTGAANLVQSVGTLTLQGNTGGTNSEAFMFVVNGFEGEGTYVIGGQNGVFVSASYSKITVDTGNPMNAKTDTWQAPYTGGAEVGNIKVTSLSSNMIEGTFEFKAQNNQDNSVKNITEGTFKLKLTRN